MEIKKIDNYQTFFWLKIDNFPDRFPKKEVVYKKCNRIQIKGHPNDLQKGHSFIITSDFHLKT